MWRRRRTQTTFFRFSCSFRQQLPLQLCGKLSSTIEVAAECSAQQRHTSFLSIFSSSFSPWDFHFLPVEAPLLQCSAVHSGHKGRRKPSVTTDSAMSDQQLKVRADLLHQSDFKFISPADQVRISLMINLNMQKFLVGVAIELNGKKCGRHKLHLYIFFRP